jgi:pimeloyl-ACP methyl ester carboxylesterase
MHPQVSQRVGSADVLKAFDSGRLFGSLHRADGGRDGGVRVLALHGWRRTSADFDKVLAGLPDSVGALALDLPGFGASPEPSTVWGTEDYAKAVEAVLPELDLPVVVLGHSFGGRVAVRLAAARPDAVRALVLTGVPLLRPGGGAGSARKPALSYRVARALHRRGVLVSDARMEAYRRKHGSADYRAATGVMRDVFVRVVNESYEEDLRGLTCPVELVWGDDDTEAPLAVAQQALALVADGTIETLPGAGHLTPLTAPDALRAAVERHL